MRKLVSEIFQSFVGRYSNKIMELLVEELLAPIDSKILIHNEDSGEEDDEFDLGSEQNEDIIL